jgi:hypothetical protein
MELSEILKVYGPLGLGWIGFLWLGRWVLARYDKELETKMTLAMALKDLTDHIKARQ